LFGKSALKHGDFKNHHVCNYSCFNFMVSY
jgi:hypothetical protein